MYVKANITESEVSYIMQQKILPFKLEFSSKEKITPYAGVGLYGEMFKALGIDKEVELLLPKPGSGAGFEANTYVYPLVMMFIGGGKYIEDIRKIQADEGLREMCQIDEVPSSDALGDWMRRMSDEKILSIQELNNSVMKKVIRKTAGGLTLDIDAMEIQAEKGDAEYTYTGNKGYMPMLGFIPELDLCVGYEFREGNIPPADKNYEFSKEIIERIVKCGSKIERLRSDSAAYQAKVLNCAEEKKIKYTIAVDKDESIVQAIKEIGADEWKPVMDRNGIRGDQEYAEFIYSMNKSNHAFRVVVLRWKNPQQDLFEKEEEYCYYGIATNYEEEKSGQEVIWWHRGRSNSENYNKALKDGFNLDYVPCGEYGANAVWFGIGILAYNLFIASKILLFPKDWMKKTIHTVRWQFIQIAGKVIRRARSVMVRLCGIPREIYEHYQRARERCGLLYGT
ncbi:MAG: IS1380 family transposase [Elusimicrobia bacterium]|nr:IS1380 family transposase [Elusimicrobiota bacterium]MBD3411864.1 IS1380 family transposase [Elusimicrobiota bacterium]